jgi:hypothetical protein
MTDLEHPSPTVPTVSLPLNLAFFRPSGEPLEWPPGELNGLLGCLFTMIREADPIAAWRVAVLERLVSRASDWPPEPLIDVAIQLLAILHVVAPSLAEEIADDLSEISSKANAMADQHGVWPPGLPREMRPLTRKIALARRPRKRGRPAAWNVPDMVRTVWRITPEIEAFRDSLATIPGNEHPRRWKEFTQDLWTQHVANISPGRPMPLGLASRLSSRRQPKARAVRFVSELYDTEENTVYRALTRARRLGGDPTAHPPEKARGLARISEDSKS